ncbi:hypothetical protein [Acidithiobacillus thiooxidans]|uniref:Uncharacterized protein n=1 Tax=Acidithiobacillus thiooxidans ATCC 19377 TaxID=637390 RepID=A0A543Q6R1_ACITH|nr:hypothetical protein [Acidithiobacillus thiooxidans]MDX5933766.1 hypothetical protein [Acidithiobacillus thiooxidans]TQN52018.1 hypothetical protein DLNHIDIE_01899 [Acidithiobacillus thiooxidans ATCC 19377]
MSDRYYGEVYFPEWAVKYVLGLKDGSGLELSPDSKTYCFEEDEARDGVPWVCDVFDKLGIPYDCASAEYYEYRGETKYLRFRKGGKLDELVVTDGDELVEARDILNMISEGKSLSDVKAWCQKTLDQIAPLTPPLEQISEADYLAWVKEKAWVFQKSVQELREGRREAVGDPYVLPDSGLDVGTVTIDGLSGLLVTRPVVMGRAVTGEMLDQAESRFRSDECRFFRMGSSYGPVGAFVPFRVDKKSIANLTITATDWLEVMTGNRKEAV